MTPARAADAGLSAGGERESATLKDPRENELPYRHWFAVLDVDGVEERIGPFATRKSARREAKAHPPWAASSVTIVYEHKPPKPGRYTN